MKRARSAVALETRASKFPRKSMQIRVVTLRFNEALQRFLALREYEDENAQLRSSSSASNRRFGTILQGGTEL